MKITTEERELIMDTEDNLWTIIAKRRTEDCEGTVPIEILSAQKLLLEWLDKWELKDG
ncbi:MAG: hypothetical protein GY804_02540 [Alphaproteobacteria bacterium]|nr:hypothetical protein [Alphaproteobacteria bacterium]